MESLSVMETYEKWNIQELPLSAPSIRRKVVGFLGSNGLRLEDVDLYMAVLDASGNILAGGGLSKDIIKCIAVAPEVRSEGLTAPLVSRLIAEASARGFHNLKVFTKPENTSVFESLGFRLLAKAPQAVLMENGRGVDAYCSYLSGLRQPGRCGVIVMNANPFTLGHQYLITKALEEVQHLFVLPVREDVSLFPYAERLAMIHSGVAAFGSQVTVAEGSAYCISAATFPTYFLKDLSDSSETQMRLDIDLFIRHIGPALGSDIRFVGTEPHDPLTARYNALLQELMPGHIKEIPRLESVSATRVRQALAEGDYARAASMTPATTHPCLLSMLAERALRLELDTPLKPGLVGPDGPGAHSDMDYILMGKGISAIRPFFPQMAVADTSDELRRLGIDAESAMLAATGGVNTHRGAIFALGLALNAFGRKKDIGAVARELIGNTDDKGARAMASSGYTALFEDWLPYYRSIKGQPYDLQRTLLRIMSTLDDTCVLHRVGAERARAVRDEARELCGAFSPEALQALCRRYAQERISPGGAADMLALTIFIDSLIH